MTTQPPAYRQVADALRARIQSGQLSPGDELPSIAKLSQEFGFDRSTIINGLKVLRGEGLLDVPGPGRPTTVRVPLPVIVRDASTRYQYEKDQVAFGGLPEDTHLARDSKQPVDQAYAKRITNEIIRDPELANVLMLRRDAPIRHYYYVITVGGVPGRLAHHYIDAELDNAVRASRPTSVDSLNARIWRGGTMMGLAEQGIEPDGVQDRVRARNAYPEEVELLNLPEGVPMLVSRKITYDTEGLVREVVDLAMPGDRSECVFYTKLKRWPAGPPVSVWTPGQRDDSDVD